MDTVVRDLDADMAVIAGHRNVTDASTVALIAEALETGAWNSPGIHSIQHWVRLHLGVGPSQARVLCTVASRWADFPDTIAVFVTGALSLAQMEVIVTRAPAWADHRMGVFAQGLSVSQLRNMIRDEFITWDTPTGDAPEPPEGDEPAPEPKPPVSPVDRFGYEWRNGRLSLHGDFGADRGTLLEAVLEQVRDELFRANKQPATGADALCEIFARAATAPADTNLSEAWGNGSRLGDVLGRVRTFLHLDIDNTGSGLAGHLSNGVRLPQSMLDYLTCDGELTPVWEHDHTPVGYGRSQRVVPTKLRRLIEHRDNGCRVPGCGLRHVEVHHLIHWEHGGTTDTTNLVSLCAKHHRQHHQGLLHIAGNPDQADGLTFTDATGKPIRATIAVVPTEPLPPPKAKFEPASLQRMTLGEFFGWTERGARTTREHRQRLRRQQETDGDPDDPAD